jgi:hypothetical protein
LLCQQKYCARIEKLQPNAAWSGDDRSHSAHGCGLKENADSRQDNEQNRRPNLRERDGREYEVSANNRREDDQSPIE